MALYVAVRGGGFVSLGPDARLYLSIADNVLSTGHFIQSVRDPGSFVVPFGLPLILTALRGLGLSAGAIIALEYLLFGWSCLLLSRSEEALFGGWWISPCLFTAALIRSHLEINNVYLEYYFLFCLIAVLYLLTRQDMPLKKKLLLLNAAGFAGFAIRTVLILVYLPILGYTLYAAAGKRLPVAAALLAVLIPWAVFAGNAAVNCRETGHWILTSNYSGADVYAANNPRTRTEFYSLRDLPDFVDERFYTITEDPALDPTEKDAALSHAAGEWIRSHPGQFLKNTAAKTWSLFGVYWRYALVLALLAGLWGIVRKEPPGGIWSVCLGVNLLLAVTTGMGLLMGRYSIVVWPLASLHLAGGWHAAWGRLRKHETK